RRVPRRLLVALGPPAWPARGGVEADQGGVGLLVVVQQQRLAVDDRRDGLAPAEARVHPPQLALPQRLAVEVVAVRAEGAERRIQPLAVGGGRAGGVGVRRMVALVRHLLGGGVLPAQAARLAVEAEDDEAVIGGRRRGLLLEAR